MRSRCLGSMLAWILKTKPLNGASAGSTMRGPPSRDCGGGAQSISACRISWTPKLLMPEPKNTGDCRPARNSSRSNGELAPRIKSTSRRSADISSGNNSSSRGLSRPTMFSLSSLRRSSPGVKRTRRSCCKSNTPRKVLPMPIGQLTGAQSIFSTDSISSSNSTGSRTSRSILLTKVMMGVLRRRQTSSSLMVCVSTPLAASITMTAASTAVSTR